MSDKVFQGSRKWIRRFSWDGQSIAGWRIPRAGVQLRLLRPWPCAAGTYVLLIGGAVVLILGGILGCFVSIRESTLSLYHKCGLLRLRTPRRYWALWISSKGYFANLWWQSKELFALENNQRPDMYFILSDSWTKKDTKYFLGLKILTYSIRVWVTTHRHADSFTSPARYKDPRLGF